MRDVSILTDNGVDLESSLELLGDLEFYDETIESFIEEQKTRLDKLKEYLSSGNKKIGEYNIESPAIIINKEGMKDFYGKEVPYKETKIVELDSEYDSEHVYYIKSMER